MQDCRRPAACPSHTVRSLPVREAESGFVRAEPIGQHEETREGVLKCGDFGQRRTLGECGLEPKVELVPHGRQLGNWIVVADRSPMLQAEGRCFPALPGPAMVSEQRLQERCCILGKPRAQAI